MKKIILLIAATFLLSSNYVLAAGSASSDTESNYDKAVKVINFAKKNEKKGKERWREMRVQCHKLLNVNVDRSTPPSQATGCRAEEGSWIIVFRSANRDLYLGPSYALLSTIL